MNAVDRCKVDDVPGAARHHARRDLSGAQAAPQQIDIEHVDVVLNRLLLEPTEAHDPRVVH